MSASEIAKLIIEIEEAVNPESGYYGKLVTWWEQDRNLSHYGIGLSNTHFFNLGTADVKDLQVLKRHDITEQRNLDIRVISDIRSPFEADEIIERLKYALRWLNDLPEDSSNQSISGKALTGLIFKDNEEWKHKENEPIRTEIDYKSYLKLQSPSLSEIAKLIIGIEEAVNPESGYYGKIVTWWEQDRSLCHYGIGLSDTHVFNLGTADVKNLQVLKKHDVIKQRDLDVRVIPDIRSTFEADEIIERLKYALRWLNDLPEDSSNQSISGKALTGLIFKDNEKWEPQENEPIRNEIDYKHYLKLQSPSLTDSKFRFSKRAKNWAIYYFILLIILGVIIAILTDSIPNEFWKLVLVGILLLLIVAVVALTLNIVSNFKWSGFQKKSLWDWLQLLVVPLILAISAFYLNYASAAKDKYLAEVQKKRDAALAKIQQDRDVEIAKKQKQQDVFKTYLSQMQNLVLKDTDQAQSNLSPRYKALATALTLTALDELDGEHKGKVIAYLAKSDLINKDNPDVDLENANLKGIELENIILTNVNISNAHMQNAKLSKVQFTASNLRQSNFSNATLDDVLFSASNLIGLNFYAVIFKNVRLANSLTKGVCLSKEPRIEVDDPTNQSDPSFITKNSFDTPAKIESEKDCKEPQFKKPGGLKGAKL